MRHALAVMGWEMGNRSIENVLRLMKLLIISILRGLLTGGMEMMFDIFRYTIQEVSIEYSIGCTIWLKWVSEGGMAQGLWMDRLRL